MSALNRRSEIINGFSEHLSDNTSILALYQCGSAAFNRLDEWSDIDFIVLVEDGMIEKAFRDIDRYIDSRFVVKTCYGEFKTSWPGVWQKVYSFENESPFHMMEVAIIDQSSSVTFTEKEIHGDIIVHFDRIGFTQPKPVNLDDFTQELRKRIDKLTALHKIYHVLPKKEINRKNTIEAYSFYYHYTLLPYIEMLRIKHCPFRYSFSTRYVYYDFPDELSKALEPYFFIPDLRTLEKHVHDVQGKTDVLIEELNALDIPAHLSRHR